jgi:polygalacturonase
VRGAELSIDGADNGVRMKSSSSRGRLAHDVVYENVCIRDAKYPILMDSKHSFYGQEHGRLSTSTDIILRI